MSSYIAWSLAYSKIYQWHQISSSVVWTVMDSSFLFVTTESPTARKDTLGTRRTWDGCTDLSDILRHPTSDIHGIHDFLQLLFFTMTVTIRHSNSHGILRRCETKKTCQTETAKKRCRKGRGHPGLARWTKTRFCFKCNHILTISSPKCTPLCFSMF